MVLAEVIDVSEGCFCVLSPKMSKLSSEDKNFVEPGCLRMMDGFKMIFPASNTIYIFFLHCQFLRSGVRKCQLCAGFRCFFLWRGPGT